MLATVPRLGRVRHWSLCSCSMWRRWRFRLKRIQQKRVCDNLFVEVGRCRVDYDKGHVKYKLGIQLRPLFHSQIFCIGAIGEKMLAWKVAVLIGWKKIFPHDKHSRHRKNQLISKKFERDDCDFVHENESLAQYWHPRAAGALRKEDCWN